MITDMKEEIARQQALFNHKMALDWENAASKREELKHLNDQLLAQIMTLQNTKGLPLLTDGPTDTETQDDEHTQS